MSQKRKRFIASALAIFSLNIISCVSFEKKSQPETLPTASAEHDINQRVVDDGKRVKAKLDNQLRRNRYGISLPMDTRIPEEIREAIENDPEGYEAQRLEEARRLNEAYQRYLEEQNQVSVEEHP